MDGWLIAVQKPRTGEIKVIAVRNPDQAAALSTVNQICAGLPATVTPLRPVDAKVLQIHGVAPGAFCLI